MFRLKSRGKKKNVRSGSRVKSQKLLNLPSRVWQRVKVISIILTKAELKHLHLQIAKMLRKQQDKLTMKTVKAHNLTNTMTPARNSLKLKFNGSGIKFLLLYILHWRWHKNRKLNQNEWWWKLTRWQHSWISTLINDTKFRRAGRLRLSKASLSSRAIVNSDC